MSEAPTQWRSRVRLVDEVAQELRERIYTGAYGLGMQLRQEQLADELQVSRTPLREALRVLEREGLLQSEPGRGARVVSADVQKLLAAYEMREVVDGLAARLAARSPDAEVRAGLLALLGEQRGALAPWHPAAYTLSNVTFHTAVFELSGNEFVAGQIPLLRMTSQVFMPVGPVEKERATLAVAEHEEIARSIAEGEPQRAEKLARAHIRSTIGRLSR
ncbi:MAG: GntR family transcriptional regulator [Solirubrobacteraceae bacterium]